MIRSDMDPEWGFQRSLAYQNYKLERQKLQAYEDPKSKRDIEQSHMENLGVFKTEIKQEINMLKRERAMEQAY